MGSPTLDLSDAILSIQGEGAFFYLAKAKRVAREKGLRILSFGIGQPDFPTPKHIVEEAKKALDEGFTGYTETAGILELREAIADYLNNRYGSDVSPEEIVVATGAKTAVFMGLAAYTRPGDEVIIFEPSYYAYAQVVKMMGGKPVYVPAIFEPGKGFRLDIELLRDKITSRTRAIVLNNPHNPTGSIFSPRQIDELLEIAREHNLVIVADEIYDNFVYGQEFKSVLSSEDWREHVVLINGFSKTFSMTGWRLGYLVARKEVIPKIIDLAVTVYSCAPSFAQKAGVAALRGDWDPVNRMIREFHERAQLLHERLSQIPGFESYMPHGAFYLFPRVSKLTKEAGITVEEFVDYLLQKYGVVILPGSSFPDKAGVEHVRFSFATSKDVIIEGTEKIRQAAEELLAEKTRR